MLATSTLCLLSGIVVGVIGWQELRVLGYDTQMLFVPVMLAFSAGAGVVIACTTTVSCVLGVRDFCDSLSSDQIPLLNNQLVREIMRAPTSNTGIELVSYSSV